MGDRTITTTMIAELLKVTQRSIQRIAKKYQLGLRVRMGSRGRYFVLFNHEEADTLCRLAHRKRGRPRKKRESNG